MTDACGDSISANSARMLKESGIAGESLVGRYYDPATGQFLSVDPLVDETGQAYAYTGNDPVNQKDPSGLGLGCGFLWLHSCPSKEQSVENALKNSLKSACRLAEEIGAPSQELEVYATKLSASIECISQGYFVASCLLTTGVAADLDQGAQFLLDPEGALIGAIATAIGASVGTLIVVAKTLEYTPKGYGYYKQNGQLAGIVIGAGTTTDFFLANNF